MSTKLIKREIPVFEKLCDREERELMNIKISRTVENTAEVAMFTVNEKEPRVEKYIQKQVSHNVVILG